MTYRESCRDAFKEHGILTVPGLYILSCLKYVHSHKEKFTHNFDNHQYNTRNREQLQIPHHRLNISQQGVDYWGSKLYNKIPARNKKDENFNVFSSRVKQLLTTEVFYSITEFLEH